MNNNTFICNQSIFNDIEILDSIENKDIFSISLSGGGCRAYCVSLGIMKAIFKNTKIENEKIPYISSVSGSSWLTMILSHCSNSLKELLLFEIDTTYNTFPKSSLLDICINIKPEMDMLFIPFIGISNFANFIINKFILEKFDIHDKKISNQFLNNLRKNWPTYIISSTYSSELSFYPIEYTPNYSLIGGKDITLLVNDINDKSINKLKSHVKEELFSSLNYNDSSITTTNIITSSSFVINIISDITSYKININNKNYNIVDGCYMDYMAIFPLLRRKCKKIFCVISCILNNEGKIDIKDNYKDVFDNYELNNIIEYINKKLSNGELCYWRGNINIKNNSYYHTTEYRPEIIFFFISRVTEFINTLPSLIIDIPELKNFPNFLTFYQNVPQILSYTKLQSYLLTSYSEWSFNKIFNENTDFFSM